jgi:hypothetical protein
MTLGPGYEAKRAPPWPTDTCHIDGQPYQIVDRALVRYTRFVERDGKMIDEEICAYTVGTLVPA